MSSMMDLHTRYAAGVGTVTPSRPGSPTAAFPANPGASYPTPQPSTPSGTQSSVSPAATIGWWLALGGVLLLIRVLHDAGTVVD